jgi:hypothetical protein
VAHEKDEDGRGEDDDQLSQEEQFHRMFVSRSQVGSVKRKVSAVKLRRRGGFVKATRIE